MADYHLIIGNRKYSSWSFRGWLAKKLSGVEFEETVIPLDLPETQDMLAKHSPTNRVPCLMHGDAVVWDSLAIAEYMAEQASSSGLWPADARLRAHARSIVAEMHSGFTALRSDFPMDMARRHNGVMPSAAVEADVARIDQIWADCVRRYGGPYLFGEWCLADCFYAPVVSRFETYGIATGLASTSYAERVKQHPHYQGWHAAAQNEPWETPLEVLMGR